MTPDPSIRVETGAKTPPEVRERQLAEIRRRLEAGELDSDLAVLETACAILDGDSKTPHRPPQR